MARVYISSTYGDLREYRASIEQDLRRLGHTDVGMENYCAEERSSMERCLDDIASCDIYVGIFAWRYGWIPAQNNPEKRSITELEHRQAVTKQKPCLIFLIDEAAPWPFVNIETERLPDIRRLRAELNERHNPELFRNGEDLRVAVTRAVARYLARNAAPDTPARIYSIDEKIRLLDGIILIEQKALAPRPMMLTIAFSPLIFIPIGIGGSSSLGGPLTLSFVALVIVICLILAVNAKRVQNEHMIEGQKEINRLRFYRSLYEGYAHDPEHADPEGLREAEQAITKYSRQGAQTK